MGNRKTSDTVLALELDRFLDAQVHAGYGADADDVAAAAILRLSDRLARRTPTAPDAGSPIAWPIAGGACGALIRSRDWGGSALGPIEHWSPQLRSTVNTIVNSPVAKVLMWGPDAVMLYNDGYARIAGDRHPDAIGARMVDVWPEIADFNRAILADVARGEVKFFRDQPMTLQHDGAVHALTFDLFYTPVHDCDGQIGGVMCTVVDNTEKVAAERQLARSELELRIVTDALPVLISYIDRDYVYRFANSFYEDWVGLTPAEVVGRHVRDVIGNAAFGVRKPWMDRALLGETVTADARLPHRDGGDRASELRYIPRIEGDGSINGFYVLVFDVEERVAREHLLERQVRHRERAEHQLRQLNETLEARVIREIDERRLAEAGLAQAQKMETIGKLTGGVAHDFNNLLQVVSGNLQLLAKDIAGNERAERRVGNAMAGISRGAKLAAQLLAFGRRQALEPKVVNVTRFVRGMDDMLRRAIGEAIEVETIVGGGLWNTFIDPAQIENALLNLAINARDAMDGRGKLTIELGNASLDDSYARGHSEVVAGQYVMLAVSDTGSGMAPDIIEKVFEPFFSTKSEGKGSGLGLSMVYGFVKQSGGPVKIYSEVGEGTTIKLYLPRAIGPEDVEVTTSGGPIAGGTETVLVVEDDDEVRATVVEMLGDLGYGVLKAVDATSGLSVIESGIPIDMLFTDVVMPGTLKSPELARKARERLPDIAVLFTSGYTENSIVHGGKLDAGVELLSKPYTREALARKFEQVLAGQRAKRSASADVVAASPRDAVESAIAARSTGLTVLLVEDDHVIRASTAETLRDAGMAVVEAVSAEEALVTLRAGTQAGAIDVLVTDVNLPGLSGPALADRVRALRPGIGIVFATGDSEVTLIPGDADMILLPKPYGLDALCNAVIKAAGVASRPARTVRIAADGSAIHED